MICQLLILVLVLWDGRPGLSRAQSGVYIAAEGGDITVRCLFYSYGNWKYFCKNDCYKTGDILVETSLNSLQIGRYSIHYEARYTYPNIMYVSITDVRSSDSGKYSCGLRTWSGWTWTNSKFSDFFIHVIKAFTPRPAVTSVLYYPTTAQQRVSSSGSSLSEHQHQSGELLSVGLTLAAVLILLAATLFILYQKRANKPQDSHLTEPPEASECAQVPESSHLYEEIQQKNRAGPVEMCPASVSASFRKTTETSEIYSLASAPSEQEQTEDCSSYSELDFTRTSSAPQSQTEAVTHEVHTEDVPLYSIVTLPQQ